MDNNPFLMSDVDCFGDTSSNPFLSGLPSKVELEIEPFGIPDAADYNPDLNPFLSAMEDSNNTFMNLVPSNNNIFDIEHSVPTFNIQSANEPQKSTSETKDLIMSITSFMDNASEALLNQMEIARTPIPSPDAELHLVPSRDSPVFGASPDPLIFEHTGPKSFNPFAEFMDVSVEPSAPVHYDASSFGGGIFSLTSEPEPNFFSPNATHQPEASEALLVDLLSDGIEDASTVPFIPMKTSLLDEDIVMEPLPPIPPSIVEDTLSAVSPIESVAAVAEETVSSFEAFHAPRAGTRPPPPKPPPPHRPPRPAAPSTPDRNMSLGLTSSPVLDTIPSPMPASMLSSRQSSASASPEFSAVPSIAELLSQPVRTILADQFATEQIVKDDPNRLSAVLESMTGGYSPTTNLSGDAFNHVEEDTQRDDAPTGQFASKPQIFQPGPEVAISRPSTKKIDPSIMSTTAWCVPPPPTTKIQSQDSIEFDAFASRFESATLPDDLPDPFGDSSAFGESLMSMDAGTLGFENTDSSSDAFLSMTEPPPVPKTTPLHGPNENSFQTLATRYEAERGPSPIIPMSLPGLRMAAADLDSPESVGRVQVFENPFLAGVTPADGENGMKGDDTAASTPLFELDQTETLLPFPRTTWEEGVDFVSWEMQMRHPLKKKLTGQRFWKKIFVKLTHSGNIQVFTDANDKEPIQELPLQPSYCVSEIAAQQFDQFGKIFTLKVQYVYYKERPGVRPGQISKAERLTSRLSQFASYAIAGDLAGVKEFGSDIKKLGVPIEHTPQVSELMKLGSHSYEDLKMFSHLVEEQLFKLTLHRDRSLTYKQEEIQITVVDEIFIEQELMGHVTCNIARMPEIELGLNDLDRQGKEVVGRHDILPVVTEEWIRLEDVDFHSVILAGRFIPPDATYIELLRFRVRPPKNRELPLQVKTVINISGKKVEIRADVLVPGSSGRKMGPVPCEDVAIRFPIPECWIYMFRTEKHFRYGSVKSAHRRHGKVKGLERFLGTVETMEQAMMEVSSGQAKYEHHHKAIVWRMSRLPKEGQGAYTTHTFICRLTLTTYDSLPESMEKYCFVEFTMPATTVSHCVARSVSCNLDEPPEKYVKYLARHEYKVAMEFTQGQEIASYLAATSVPTNTRPISPALSAANSDTKAGDDSSDSE
ncbi:unnamed protein product [Notodromas monacha]|uniref:Protein stoned-B n=1 Tax=Notodromas monacha TaxID=399045 RepID=A0A7R9BFR9_9CRUS|nr:unnamed protein product [Notodromas monacha]CAG0913019.1 unnamed protein product [Notodromas monacha]